MKPPKSAYFLFKLIFALIKIPLVGIVFITLILLESFFSSRFLRKTIYSSIARILLFLIGFHSIEFNSYARVRKSTKDIKGKQGGVIICNHLSYVDILYLYYRYSPKFTLTDTSGNIQEITFLQALNTVGGVPKLRNSVPLLNHTLPDEYYVIFPEGTTTSGRSVLRFPDGFTLPTSNHSPLILSFQYIYENVSPCYVHGSKIWHLFRLSLEFSNKLRVTYFSPDNTEISSEDIRDILCKMARIRKVNLSLQDKEMFLEFYNEKQIGYGKKKLQ